MSVPSSQLSFLKAETVFQASEIKSVDNLKSGDILVTVSRAYKDPVIHLSVFVGDDKDYPLPGPKIIHAVKRANMLAMHTLSFYTRATHEGTELVVIRPQNDKLALKVVELLKQWYKNGETFSLDVEKQQNVNKFNRYFKNDSAKDPKEFFSVLRPLKHLLRGEIHPNILGKGKGITCHSIIIDAFNCAALGIYFKDEKVEMPKLPQSIQISNKYSTTAREELQPRTRKYLQFIQKQRAEKTRAQSPFDFLDSTQYKVFKEIEVSALKLMPIPLNPKLATAQDVYIHLAQSNLFSVIGKLSKRTTNPVIKITQRDIELVHKYGQGHETQKMKFREGLCSQLIQYSQNRTKRMSDYKKAVKSYKDAKYDKAIQSLLVLEKTTADELMKDKSTILFTLSRAYEKSGQLQLAEKTMIQAKTLRTKLYGENAKQTLKCKLLNCSASKNPSSDELKLAKLRN